uniref:Uncharacterized protein n=1 Tax=Fagus sylvatica TaxID=28930 RepID=A0A2N9EZD0_FAGSY
MGAETTLWVLAEKRQKALLASSTSHSSPGHCVFEVENIFTLDKALKLREVIEATAKVECLFNPVTRTWNNSLLETEFLPDDVIAIKGIPLSSRPSPDRLIWKATSHGNYSVKSAYHLMKAEVDKANPSCSSNPNSKLWSCNNPRKALATSALIPQKD